MCELIIFRARKVAVKGLDILALPDENKVKSYFFIEDYGNLLSLKKIRPCLQNKLPTLFYPACGADVLFPLKYVKSLFPVLKEINFLFNDIEDNLPMIKTVLDDIKISFSEKNNEIKFYWHNLLVNLKFIIGNTLEILPELSTYDIYFEQSFRIMKSYYPEYENQAYQKLKPRGILISDSGFQQFPLNKLTIPLELSSY